MLRQKIHTETVTTANAIKLGAKKAQLAKWVKEGKLKSISFGGKNRYLTDNLKMLLLESFVQ